jgi:hypothetical protein
MAREFCPAPRTIGIGPMSMMAPALALLGLRFESDPSVINKTPMKMMAKAAKNNHVASENGEVAEDATGLAVGSILV